MRTSADEVLVSFRNLVDRIPTTTYGTFGLYRYPAKFIPHIIAYVLEQYGCPGTRLLDPFAGYGTVGLVARLYNCHYELWDLNPILDQLHSIAIMEPIALDIEWVLRQIINHQKHFYPKWSNVYYWYPAEVLERLNKIWGFYHALPQSPLKQILLIPLLKVTRLFSYNDPQRQKLSKSPKSIKRVQALLQGDWWSRLLEKIGEEIALTLQKLQEYHSLNPNHHNLQSVVRGGVDSLEEADKTTATWDFLITSPPYLQAQEYLRFLKMDLFWCGFSESQIKGLQSREMPYRSVPAIPILSESFHQIYSEIPETRMRKIYEQYFFGVLGVLTRLASRINSRLFLFVGQATIRGQPIPIDRIFIEHFTALGWKHEITLIDHVISRVMFQANTNPATGMKDKRIPSERLIILKQ